MKRPRYSVDQSVIDAYHFAHYHRDPTQYYAFMGFPLLQNPGDLWIYQELVYEHRPQCIITTGVNAGGFQLYLASMTYYMPDMSETTIVGVDHIMHNEAKKLVGTKPLIFVEGDVLEESTLERVKEYCTGRSTMVVLDTNHSKNHVLREIGMYGPLVTPGQYLVVEDTNVNGHPVFPGHGPGPYEAVEEFLQSSLGQQFEVSRLWEKNMFTYHTWLHRKDKFLDERI